MISPTDYQNILCLLETGIIAGYETYNQLVLASETLKNGNGIGDIRRVSFSGDLLTATESLYLLDNTFVEEKNFISELQKHIVYNYGSLNSFLVSNGIIVPEGVAELSALVGHSIPTTQIGVCSNSMSSSSSSSTSILSVSRLSNTDFVWKFNKDFSNTSFSLEDVAGLTLGGSTVPVSVLSIASPMVILQYPSNSHASWTAIPPIGVIFTDGTSVISSSGSID